MVGRTVTFRPSNVLSSKMDNRALRVADDALKIKEQMCATSRKHLGKNGNVTHMRKMGGVEEEDKQNIR